MLSFIAVSLGRCVALLGGQARSILVLVAMTGTALLGSVTRSLGMAIVTVGGILGALLRLVRGLLFAGKISIVCLPIVVVGFFVAAALSNPYFRAGLSYDHERSSAVEIFDAREKWIGIIPPASFGDWSNGTVLSQDHAAVPPGKIPAGWRRCIVFLEDREFDRISRAFGIDPLAVLKSGWQTMSGERRRGASTLYMQVVRMLQGRSPGSHEAPGEVIVRKMGELLGAQALVRMLNEGDSDAASRFIGMHLPLVIGTPNSAFGDPLYGVELASRILFGNAASALSIEKQAILAAAVKTPILMAPPGDEKGRAEALARWKRVKDRAGHCLRNAFRDQAVDTAQALDRLAGLELPVPAIDLELAQLLPADAAEAWKITVNPVRRSLYFARQEQASVRKQLDAFVGPQLRGQVTSVHLTTTAADSRRFESAVNATLARLQSQLAGLQWSLTPGEQSSADVVMSCVDPEARIQRIFESRPGLFLNRKSPIGSVAKEIAAVALGNKSRPETQFCLAPMRGVASSSGGSADCQGQNSHLSARDAFGRSNNQAVHWALRNLVSKERLQQVTSAFKLPAFDRTPPETALTLGTFEMTPVELLRMQQTIGSGLADQHLDVSRPGIISRVAVLDPAGVVQTREIQPSVEITRSDLRQLFTVGVKSFVASALSATSDEGGTLASLHGLKQQLHGRFYAKTGTVSVTGSTRELHIAGSFFRDGKPWSFVVTVGTPQPIKPLGSRLVATHLAPLATLAVCGAEKTSLRMTTTIGRTL